MAEAGFIPGIYNFCDRWCEKCSRRENCLSYAMGKKLEEKLGLDPEDNVLRKNENVWVYLKSIFDSTYEILRELADERGIEMEDIYASENLDMSLWSDDLEYIFGEGEHQDIRVEDSDILKIYLMYESMADDCLERLFGVVDEKYGSSAGKEGKKVEEAMDSVNWFIDIIHTKIRRALYGYYSESLYLPDMERKQDYTGSAKVVLVAIRESVKAWKTLQKYCDSEARDISHLLVVLSQLKRDIEVLFPTASAFVRPGFDGKK